MKFFTSIAALALAAGAMAYTPYPCYLSQEDADDIVGGFASVLTNTTWKGKYPVDTYKVYLRPDYVENSDSVLSLKNKSNPLGNNAAPATVGRDEWYMGVSQHPIGKITTKDILVAGGSNILWYWTFEGIGINAYPATGFNLFRIDDQLQIAEADIEFNSVAWGDIFEIQQYCSGPP